MIKPIKSVAIVGGGTSAWFCAAYLNHKTDFEITVIDKEQGQPVGVGEGTLLGFQKFMEECGFETSEWFDKVGATFKSGILFPGWGSSDNLVWHPFFLNREYEEYDTSVFESWTHLQENDFNDNLALFNVSVHRKVDTENIRYYAMHVDCGKVVDFIKEEIADDINFIQSEVVDINRNSDGIESVKLKNQNVVHADFYIDATGWKNLLQESPEIVDLKGRLFCDTAVAGHIPYEDKEFERHPYVVSEAVDDGWVWSIPVQDRIGSGLVFNRGITDPETAKLKFCDYWNNRIEPDNLKLLKWDPYYVKNPWNKNVVAIGLSGGFIEPLESSGIAMITNGTIHFANRIISGYYTENDIEIFNAVMNSTYEETVDYINMHYAYNDKDTDFWNYVKETWTGSDLFYHLKEKIEHGERLNNEGKGLIFSLANWNVWMLQIVKSIKPNINIDKQTASRVMADWQAILQTSFTKKGTISHTKALERAPELFDNCYDD